MNKPSWPRAPVHQLSASGTYMVTAGTYGKAHYFRTAKRLSVLERGILKVAERTGWRLEAWAVFSNHYHFIGHSPAEATSAESLRGFISELHTRMATWVNRLDGKEGRKVWHNYWDSRLSFQASYLARLKYVHQNPVHHGLVDVANCYPWCSAGWFERNASPAQVKSLYGFKVDQIRVLDPYQVDSDW